MCFAVQHGRSRITRWKTRRRLTLREAGYGHSTILVSSEDRSEARGVAMPWRVMSLVVDEPDDRAAMRPIRRRRCCLEVAGCPDNGPTEWCPSRRGTHALPRAHVSAAALFSLCSPTRFVLLMIGGFKLCAPCFAPPTPTTALRRSPPPGPKRST